MSPGREARLSWAQAVETARQPALRLFAFAIVVAALTLAVHIGFCAARMIRFEYHASHGIAGWISANHYPKRQDFFFFFFALTLVPVVTVALWSAWVASALWMVRAARLPLATTLKRGALASLWILALWARLRDLPNVEFPDLFPPIGLAALTFAGLSLHETLGRARNGGGELPATRSTESPEESAPALPRIERDSSCRPVGFFILRAFDFFLLPVFLYAFKYAQWNQTTIDLFHEGERLIPMQEALRGAVPFRDVYIQHGLLHNAWLPLLGGRLFDSTLMGARAMDRLLYPLGCVGFYFLGLAVFRGRGFSACCLALFLPPMLIHSESRLFFGALAVGLVAGAVKGPANLAILCAEAPSAARSWGRRAMMACLRWGKRLVLAGLASSLAFWHSVEMGFYAGASIGLFLLAVSVFQRRIEPWRRPLPLICYGLGALAGFWLIGVYFLWHGAFLDMIRNTIIQCAYQTDAWGLRFPSVFDALKPVSTAGIVHGWRQAVFSEGAKAYWPIISLLAAVAYLTWNALGGTLWRASANVRLLLLVLAGIVFFRSALGRFDLWHLTYGGAFAFATIVFFLDRGVARVFDRLSDARAGGRRRLANAARAGWILLPVFVAGWYFNAAYGTLARLAESWTRLMNNPFRRATAVEILNRAGPIAFNDEEKKQARHIAAVVEAIQSHTARDDKVFDFSNQAGYLFFAGRRSVTRYFQACYASAPSFQREVIDALEKDRTRLVILKTGGDFDRIDGVPNEERLPIIARYLRENYRQAADIEGTILLERIR